MAKLQYLLGCLSLLIVLCNGLPVVPKQEELPEEEGLLDEEDTGLEYDRYLRQVIKVLEKDPEMRKRMEELSLEDLKEGNFARRLDFLGANIRTKLDELKRIEVNRLRTVARQRMEASMNPGSKKMDSKAIENMVGHVDAATMDKFTDQDFERLIKKAAADLDEADKERRKEFKRYEMEKELQRRQGLKEMDDSNKLKAEEEFKRRKEKIKNHPKIKHPGSKAQMQEVWEETDHLDPDDFNPKTFFALHDTNGDKKLDMFELEALFIKEVEKIYKDKDDADPREKFEEMSRMREHVLREIDLDGDKMVSRDEFLKAADQAQFENDDGWKDINQEDQFTEDELQEYNKMVQDRLERKKMKMQRAQLQKEGFNINQGNVQMNQQVNQPPPVGGDPKLRVNQPPPVNPQVPNQGQVNVNQAAAQQLAAQQAAQQQAAAQQAAAQQAAAQQAAAQQAAAQQAAAQQAAAQQAAAQQAAAQAQQGQVPPQQGQQQQGGVPQQQQQQQQSHQQQQLTQQQQEMIEAQRQHQLKMQQDAQRQQQQQQLNAQQQQQLNAQQQQQLNAQQQQQLNAQQQQQLNAQQQQQLNAQQQQQLNAQQQQQNQQQQQQNIQIQQGQPGQPIQGGQPPSPPQDGAQGNAPAQPPAKR